MLRVIQTSIDRVKLFREMIEKEEKNARAYYSKIIQAAEEMDYIACVHYLDDEIKLAIFDHDNVKEKKLYIRNNTIDVVGDDFDKGLLERIVNELEKLIIGGPGIKHERV